MKLEFGVCCEGTNATKCCDAVCLVPPCKIDCACSGDGDCNCEMEKKDTKKLKEIKCLKPSKYEEALSERDPHSYSRPDLIKTTHIYWDFKVNFDKKILDGFVILTLQKVSSDVHTLILDGKSLNIKKVADADTNNELKYHYEKR